MRHSAALACGLLLPAALVLPVQAQDNEAEKLFRDMRKKLGAADAIRFSVSTEIKTANKDGDSSFKGSVLLAKGNKAQLKGTMLRTWKGELVSNGEQAYLTLGERETTVATPKHLNGVLIFFVSRTGVLLTFQAMQSLLRGLGDTRPEDLFKGADRDRAAVWDFKLAPAEKIEGREVKVVNFRYGSKDAPGMPISISIDAKTLLPLKLVIDNRKGGGAFAGAIITETYSEFTLEPKIDAEAFVLPK
jgi:outer membrane lipoprotein-sorting protein